MGYKCLMQKHTFLSGFSLSLFLCLSYCFCICRDCTSLVPSPEADPLPLFAPGVFAKPLQKSHLPVCWEFTGGGKGPTWKPGVFCIRCV
ncbi:hypothetical protein Micbo1qcDRAFT_17543 [Microdochium bolleyi]|uniref:Uncharacterized protein n=1 Tax=Microdochium bolleyi TaxID=196109 RepID=A0A136IUI0_9PEZI|nr:hypothetical protein Micbo1qcDRAFT_17543 [Microdochium bolleyi]